MAPDSEQWFRYRARPGLSDVFPFSMQESFWTFSAVGSETRTIVQKESDHGEEDP
jgi:hypothetical protein